MRVAPKYAGKTEEELSRVCIEQCGSRCCKGPGVIGLSPSEAETFRGRATLHQDDYAPYMLFAEQPGGVCPNLDEAGKCKEYETRPGACRAYPNLPFMEGCLLAGWEPPKQLPKIVLATVHGRTTFTDWMRVRDNIMADMTRRGILAGTVFASTCRVDMNRNDCIESFLKSDADAILFCDDDMDFPPDLAWRLWQANKPVACGLYFQRTKGQPYPHAYRYLGYLPDAHGQLGHLTQDLRAELHELLKVLPASDSPICNEKPGPYMDVDAAGIGCALIHREVLEKVGYPWFRTQDGTHGDMMFFRKVRQAGFSVTMDLGCICAHAGYRSIGLRSFLEACGEWEGPTVNSKEYWDAAHREEFGSLRTYAGLGEVLGQIAAQCDRTPVEIVDFGCGRTTLPTELHQACDCHITGLDQSSAAIADNTRRMACDTWAVADVTDARQVVAALDGRLGDITFSNSVIEHLKNPKNLLDNMWQATAPGGLMVLGIPLELPHAEHVWTFDYDAIVNMLRMYAWPLYVYPLQGRAVVAVPKPEEA